MYKNVIFSIVTTIQATENCPQQIPDVDGVYDVQLSPISTMDDEEIKLFFNEDSSLSQQIDAGIAMGEYGSVVRTPKCTPETYTDRFTSVQTDKVAFRVLSVRVEESKDGYARVCGKILPTGPYADALIEALRNPAIRVIFGGRYY